jgi:hypothetical protein
VSGNLWGQILNPKGQAPTKSKIKLGNILHHALGIDLSKKGCVKHNLIEICLVIVAAAVLLSGSSCTTVVNRRPTITTLEAETEWIAPLGNLQVTCTASDPDGDGLNYEWVTTEGDVSATGAVAVWTGPEEVGMYNITVVVDDGHGGTDTAFLGLIVSNGPPPIIRNLIITAQEPKYLKTTSNGYKVGKTKEYRIECIASGINGELIYEWSCTGGEISGGGSLITWAAPDASGYVTVTAKILDGVGNWVRKNVVFDVVDCSSCTFG